VLRIHSPQVVAVIFLPRTAQQVKSRKGVHELARAAAALLGLVSWGGVLLLLAG